MEIELTMLEASYLYELVASDVETMKKLKFPKTRFEELRDRLYEVYKTLFDEEVAKIKAKEERKKFEKGYVFGACYD